jgi:hypothetical protein
MNILLDNTGFQNFGMCFHHSLDPNNLNYGIKDFLQFCIQIVFYDKITISTIVPKQIMEKSDEIINDINNRSSDIIDIDNLDLQYNDFNDILDNVAEEFSHRINSSFEKCRKLISTDTEFQSHIPKLNEETNKLFTLATDAIKNKKEDIIAMLTEKSKNEKIDSSFFDIVTRKINSQGDMRIIDKIYDFISETGTYNILMGNQLISDLRYCSNQCLSYKFERPYVPAVIRAGEYMRDRHEIYIAIDNIFQIINKSRFKWTNIELPSFEEYLLIKGKGSPERIFDAAVEARRIFTSVREYIRNAESKEYEQSEYNEVLKSLKLLANDVYKKMVNNIHFENTNVVENYFAIPQHFININVHNSQIALGENINQKAENNIFNDNNIQKNDLSKCFRAISEITRKMIKEKEYSFGNNDALYYKGILENNCINK